MYVKVLDGYLEHEPQTALVEMCTEKYGNAYGIKCLVNYDDVWSRIIKNHGAGENYFYGGFVGYDDSPRHGNRGTVVYGQTPRKFKKYLICLLAKAYRANCDMVFLNAWNEWGEGMYLEPDVQYGDGYLQAIKEARKFVDDNMDVLSSLIDNLITSEKNENHRIDGLMKQNERYRNYWMILRDWLNLNEEGKTVTQNLKDKNIHKVAIYGMGMLGTPLYQELINNNFEVPYCIDQDITKGDRLDVPVYTYEDDWQEVELIIVAVSYSYESIKNKIMEKGTFNIISLKDLIEYASK